MNLGCLINLLTFPGVIVHEMGHLFFCRLLHVRVFEVRYFRFGNPAGYVIHETPKNTFHHMMIGVGPFFFNTVVGALAALSGASAFLKSGAALLGTIHGTASPGTAHTVSTAEYASLWLGISIAMHAFPSTGDARGIWRALWVRGAHPLARLIGIPIVGLIYLGALGSMLWLDLVYGVAVSFALPLLFTVGIH